jgi:hypothetical protein
MKTSVTHCMRACTDMYQGTLVAALVMNDLLLIPSQCSWLAGG